MRRFPRGPAFLRVTCARPARKTALTAPFPAPRTPLMKSILITGCSSGIGLDAAQTLKAAGWRVFASCRQQADCDRLAAMGFESPRLDYTDPASIDAALAEVLEATGGRLDALFNNGAYTMRGAVEDVPTDALRAIFEANFFGWHHLTAKALRLLFNGQRVVDAVRVLRQVVQPIPGRVGAHDAPARGLCSQSPAGAAAAPASPFSCFTRVL